MKILWHSNLAGLGTGYAVQTALFAQRIKAMGHDVMLSAVDALYGRHAVWEGMTILPTGNTMYGNDILVPHAERFFAGDPGLILILCDAWVFEPTLLRNMATAVWSPVHSRPMSVGDQEFYKHSGAQPIAMSRYGEGQMREAGLQPIYVPHAVDTSIFRPPSGDERVATRDRLQIPQDAFVITIVAANKDHGPPRKGWGEQFAAFAQLRKRHPEALLFVHSMIEVEEGLDLAAIIRDLGIEEAVRFSGQYSLLTGGYTQADVAALMGCSDVLSNCSWGEGFGLPALEAQACGTPVVVADNSAQTELCGSGWKVECQPYWHWHDQAWWHAPSIRGITRAYEKAYSRARDPQVRQKAREFALAYDADTVATQYWKPALEMLEQYAGAVPVRSPHRNHGSIPLPSREADGLRWIQRGGHTDDMIAIGHEESLTPVLDRLLPDGGVFLDVGAHVGRWSLRLAKKASRVVSVEANPATAAVLRAHVALNGITNVEVIEAAAWDEDTTLDLSDPQGKVAGGSTRVLPQRPLTATERQQVKEGRGAWGLGTATARHGQTRALPLDDVLAAEPRIDLVKLDVEGADLHALRGMATTLARCRPVLFVERHDIYGYYRIEDLRGLLEGFGYECEDLMAPLPGGRVAPYIVAWPQGHTEEES